MAGVLAVALERINSITPRWLHKYGDRLKPESEQQQQQHASNIVTMTPKPAKDPDQAKSQQFPPEAA